MPIRGKKQRFTDNNIDKAPNKDGVYVLSRYGETTYVGKATGGDGLQGRLEAHKRGDTGRGIKSSTSFQVEKCKDAPKREKQLLEQYKKIHGKLPRYNDRIG